MSAPRRRNALTQVAQARLAADRSLDALHARRAAWSERLRQLPYWAVLLGGFVGGAVAGRVFTRVRPRREFVSLLTTLAPVWRRIAEVILARWTPAAASTPPTAGDAVSAAAGTPPRAGADVADR